MNMIQARYKQLPHLSRSGIFLRLVLCSQQCIHTQLATVATSQQLLLHGLAEACI